VTTATWDNFITAHQGHLLQSQAWGALKSNFGWTPVVVQTAGAGAQILFKRLPLGFTIAYIPKGPVGLDWADPPQCDTFFASVHAQARARRAIFLKVEPNGWPALGAPHPAAVSLTTAGFIPADTIQPRTTLRVSLGPNEDAILAAMKQKTRYNIRLAQKKGVVVRQGGPDDVANFHQLAQTTADRNNFGVHSLAYYQTALHLFAPNRATLLLAQFEGRPIAALMVFCQGPEAYYFYGASGNEQRHLMAPYLLQWEAMRWAKSRGCATYDLWGIPDAPFDTLEAEFEQRHDGLWGVYRFKRGFGGQYCQSAGAFDYVYRRPLHRLYRWRRGGL
jgi:lipid II:glycine glycyltransferase (peptidoglycan interpeptide bridge formation enzyme)